MKLRQTIKSGDSPTFARQTRNLIHRLAGDLGRNDVLVISLGPDGNLYHGVNRANVGNTASDVISRINNIELVPE